jgi:hypothetical protein
MAVEIKKNNPYVPTWDKWSDEVVQGQHGQTEFYRNLYYGNHGEIFERATELIKNGEIVDNISNGKTQGNGNIRTPYIMANVSKLIPEIPALFVSRAIGKITVAKEQTFTEDGESIKLSKYLENIERDSKLKVGHYSNVLQQQIDGGIVGIPVKDENGVRIDFKKREVYFPHEDGLGCDLAYKRRLLNEQNEMLDYLHVHRERVEEGNLTCEEILYLLGESNELEVVEESEAKWILGMDSLIEVYAGRTRPFAVYWANESTFDFPLGVSSLLNQANKQDEINWTLTRLGIVFQRNGKPRMAVSKEVMSALQQKAMDRYGDENKIDHRDLEVVTMDENGKHMEIIQIDVARIGNIGWVKDLMKLMFIETKTSEKAVDFYLEGGSGGAQSGIAKFYDLFISIIKAEKLADEYIDFLQELIENCMWLMAQDAPFLELAVERPNIEIKDMIPTTRKERVETESLAKESGIRSTERAVRIINPNDSDEALEEELTLIEEGAQSVDSNTNSPVSLNSLSNMVDNRDKPLTKEDGADDVNVPKVNDKPKAKEEKKTGDK